MRLLGTLRVSTLCLLVSAFHGPRGVFCSNLEVNPYAESSTVEVSEISENPKDSTVNTGDGAEGDLAVQVRMLQAKLQALEAGLDNASEEPSTDNMAESIVESPLVKKDKDIPVKSPRKRGLDLIDELNVRSPKELENYDELNGELVHKSKIKKAGKDLFEQHSAVNVSEISENHEDSTVESQDAVPEDRKEPHGFSDFSNDSDSEYDGKEPIKEAEKSSEEHEPYHVARKTETDVTSDPSTINLSDGSKNPDGSMATPSSNGKAEAMEAEQEERLKEMQEISENPKDSPVESFSKSSAPAPQSCLVFENATWDDSQLASSVLFINEFCEGVKGYKFSGKISAGNIRKLDKACWWVNSYLKSFSWRRVRGLRENPYKDALKPEKFKDYAEWLVKNLPVIRTSMRNMYNESIGLTEEQLKAETLTGPYKYGFVHNDNWWRAVGSQVVIYQLVMAPSFLQSLENLQSSLENILNGPKEFTVESKPSVPVTKSNLVFENSTWDDSMLASTFLFLEEFCQEVKAKKFNEKLSDKKFKDLSEKCEYVSAYVGSFIHRFKPTYGPGSVTERKEIPMNFYKDVLKAEDFDVYAKWLVKNIPNIDNALFNMYGEGVKLTATELNTETSMGPLRYGFVYTGKPWGELSHGASQSSSNCSDISQSFKGLKSSLDDILGNSITKKILSLFSRGKKSDVNPKQEDSTVKSQAA